MKQFEVYLLIQVPNADNWHTSGWKRILSLGKTIDEHNLWWYETPTLNLGILEFTVNRNPHYYTKDKPNPVGYVEDF